MNEIEEIAEQRRIARILCQDEKGKCLHNATSCESHIECAFTIWAQKLLNAGYGDVRQAVRELVEKITVLLLDYTTPCFNLRGEPIIEFNPDFYDKIKEFFK